VYPALAAAHLPTAAELLARNTVNVLVEQASTDKTLINALIARWGPDLTLRLEISLPPPALPSEKALIIYFYMPVLDSDDDISEHAVHWKSKTGSCPSRTGAACPRRIQ